MFLSNGQRRLELPETLREQMFAFRRRVWAIKLTEAACGAAFGVLVAAGVAAGIVFAQVRARKLGVADGEINAAMAWALIAGFLGSHLVVLLTEPDAFAHGPRSLVEFWHGMSAFGGFFGALVGLAVYFARRRRGWLVEADILVQALVIGWIFGRLGCTLVHDHVGSRSDFPLGAVGCSRRGRWVMWCCVGSDPEQPAQQTPGASPLVEKDGFWPAVS